MLQDFKSWAAKPFSADMDALHWFYFFGLVVIIAMGWGTILNTIKRAAS